jgi:hypothetical protein
MLKLEKRGNWINLLFLPLLTFQKNRQIDGGAVVKGRVLRAPVLCPTARNLAVIWRKNAASQPKRL